MGMLPTKGLTLPLMSAGGSAIMAACLAMGMVLRVNFENHLAVLQARPSKVANKSTGKKKLPLNTEIKNQLNMDAADLVQDMPEEFSNG